MKLQYYLLKAVFWLFSKIPFWFYHGISTALGLLFFYLRIYRFRVVMNNLSKSFPNKSETEIKAICRKFYLHLSDLIIESIKAFGFSQQTIMERYKIRPSTEVQSILDQKGKIAMILPHFANWEWSTQGMNFMSKTNQPLILIMYKPLKNKLMDKLVKQNRSRFKGNYLFPKKNALREVIKHKDTHYLLGFAADQRPPNLYTCHWMTFLGRETGVFMGVEKFSKKFDLIPVYAHVDKVARSKYEVSLEVITHTPKSTKHGYITEQHMRLLEEDIYKNPHLWLWSHKRWKKEKPADYIAANLKKSN